MAKSPGVYICSGCSIGESLDTAQLAKVAESEFKVPRCQVHPFLCSPEGVALIEKDLADGVGPTKHLGLIAGRSTWGSAEYDWGIDSFKNDKVLAHAKLMHASLPTVVC